jgi:hypothetical protein
MSTRMHRCTAAAGHPPGGAGARHGLGFIRTRSGGGPERIGLVLLAWCLTQVSSDGQDPGGSLLLKRQELLRKWDLDRDGKIDAGEAELAAAKMRRERSQMRVTPGLESLTNPFGGAAEESADTPQRSPLFPWAAGIPGPEAGSTSARAGRLDATATERGGDQPPTNPLRERPTTLPRPTSPEPARDQASRGAAAGRPAMPQMAQPRITQRRNGSSSATDRPAGSSLFGELRPSAVIGGPRAGAEPARPGYGSGVATDLNSGRPRPGSDRTSAGDPAGERPGAGLRWSGPVPQGNPGTRLPGGGPQGGGMARGGSLFPSGSIRSGPMPMARPPQSGPMPALPAPVNVPRPRPTFDPY